MASSSASFSLLETSPSPSSSSSSSSLSRSKRIAIAAGCLLGLAALAAVVSVVTVNHHKTTTGNLHTDVLADAQTFSLEFVASANSNSKDFFKGVVTVDAGKIRWNVQHVIPERGTVTSRSADESNRVHVETVHGTDRITACETFPYVVPDWTNFAQSFRGAPEAHPQCAADEATYETLFDARLYHLCVRGVTPTKLIGADFALTVTSFSLGTVAIPASAHPCATAAKVVGRAPRPLIEHSVSSSDAYAKAWSHAHELNARFSRKALATKNCVFLHGAGQTEDLPPTSTFDEYWGSVDQKTPQCAQRTFIHANSRTRPWTDPDLQRMFCEAAMTYSTGETIENTIVFTHSMGNNVFSGALANNLCKIGSTASWYSVSGPILGSRICDVLEQICANQHPSATLTFIVNVMGMCSNGAPDQAYLSLKEGDPSVFEPCIEGFKQRKGLLCGTTPAGLASPDSVGLVALAQIGHMDDQNDGMVDFDSCGPSVSTGEFGSTSVSDYYMSSLNHGDTTCRNGDGWFGQDRMPCSWYGLRD